jgi:hypothetical protein
VGVAGAVGVVEGFGDWRIPDPGLAVRIRATAVPWSGDGVRPGVGVWNGELVDGVAGASTVSVGAAPVSSPDSVAVGGGGRIGSVEVGLALAAGGAELAAVGPGGVSPFPGRRSFTPTSTKPVPAANRISARAAAHRRERLEIKVRPYGAQAQQCLQR